MSRISFAALDWLVVALFIGALVAIFFGTRLKAVRFLDFLTAGRSLTLPVFVATLVSTWYGGILGVGEAVHDYGIGTWLLLGVPYYVFGVVYALTLARRVRQGAELSIPERLSNAWGRGVGVTGGILVLLLAVPAAHVFMLGTLLQLVFGWPLWVCVGVSGLAAATLLVRAGLLTDARLGVLAFCGMYVGFLAIDLFCLRKFSLGADVAHLTGGAARLDGGQGILAVLSFFILGAWTLVDPAFHQRVTSCESPAVGRKGVFWSVACWMVFDLLSIVAGLFAISHIRQMPENPVALYPAFGDQVLPAGLRGLFMIGMTGTILSALAGYMLVSGATIGREILGRLFPTMDDADYTRVTRIGLFVSALLAAAIGLYVNSIVDLWYSWAGGIVGALLIPVLLAYFDRGRQLSAWAIGASMVGAFLVSMALLIASKRTQNDFLTVSWLGQTFSLGTLVPALLVSAVILGLASATERVRRTS